MQVPPARGRGRQRARPGARRGEAAQRVHARSSTSCRPLSMVAILWYGGHQVLDGNLQVGDILAFNLYILMLIWPLRMIGHAHRAGVARVGRRRARARDPRDRPGDRRRARTRVALPAGPGELRVRGRARSATGRAARCSTGSTSRSAAARRSRIVGATGSGKTTVARLLPRFYDIEAGRILLDGVDVRDLRRRRAAEARSGIVFEDTFLFSDSVRENIAFADPDASLEQVRAGGAARRARTSSSTRCPDGYDTIIGEHGFSLSGGQRQRIAIARAVIADPRVLILDDATSSVDPTKEHEIRAALGEVMDGRTTIIIAHRPGDDRARRPRGAARRRAGRRRPARTTSCSRPRPSTGRCSRRGRVARADRGRRRRRS